MTRSRNVVPAVLIGAVLLLGACSDDKAPSVATAGSGAGGSASRPSDPHDRALLYAKCLRQHGLDARDPEPDGTVKLADGSPPDPQKAGPALAACAPYLPDQSASAKPAAEDLDRLRAYARCLREHGVPAWPDPDPETGGWQFSSPEDARRVRADPKLAEASTACADLARNPRSGDDPGKGTQGDGTGGGVG